MMQDLQDKPKRAIVAAVQLPSVSDVEFDASISELRQLAKTLGFEIAATFTQKRAHFNPVAYLGAGKREEMRRFVQNEADPGLGTPARDPELEPESESESKGGGHGDSGGGDSHGGSDDGDGHGASDHGDGHGDGHGASDLDGDGDDDGEHEPGPKDMRNRKNAPARTATDPETWRADVVLVDHEISPTQTRNLEKEIGCEVMDRTMVILEIFHRHARSRAARAQVEIVRLGYLAPRMREAAKLAGPQGRQRSGIGGRGAGESKGELDRRKIRDRIAELQKELDAMDVERKTQRARRQERIGLARVAFVGYTNAGKSTLVRALTGSDVLVADKLFATLDTTVRALQPETVPRVLISDTVGFIKNLPHGLVASFKSTLDEALEASLLAHVIDASDPAFERQRAVTEQVLEEIGARDVPRILIFNKIDRAGDPALNRAGDPAVNRAGDPALNRAGDPAVNRAGESSAQGQVEAALRLQYPGCIVMSARREGDIRALHDAIGAFFQKRLVEAELFLPWSAQQARGDIFANCAVIEERADNEGTLLRVRGEPEVVQRLLRHHAPQADSSDG